MVFTVRYILGILLVLISCSAIHSASISSRDKRETISDNQVPKNESHSVATTTESPSTVHPDTKRENDSKTENATLSAEPTPESTVHVAFITEKVDNRSEDAEATESTTTHVASVSEKVNNITKDVEAAESTTTHVASVTEKANNRSKDVEATATVPAMVSATTTENIIDASAEPSEAANFINITTDAIYATTNDTKGPSETANLISNTTENSKQQARTENGRSLDFDISRYTSPEFHNKNNVYNLPTSPENERYVSSYYDQEVEVTTKPEEFSKFTHTSELTTPASEFFDARFHEVEHGVAQDLEDIDHYFETPKTSLNDIIEKAKRNGTESNLDFLRYTSVINDNKEDKNSVHKSYENEERLKINFDSVYNDTKVVKEETLVTSESPITLTTTEMLANPEKIVTTTRRTPPTKFSLVNKTLDQDSLLSNKIETETIKPSNKEILDPIVDQKELNRSPEENVISVSKRGSTKFVEKESVIPIGNNEQNVEENNIIAFIVTTAAPEATTPRDLPETTETMYEITDERFEATSDAVIGNTKRGRELATTIRAESSEEVFYEMTTETTTVSPVATESDLFSTTAEMVTITPQRFITEVSMSTTEENLLSSTVAPEFTTFDSVKRESNSTSENTAESSTTVIDVEGNGDTTESSATTVETEVKRNTWESSVPTILEHANENNTAKSFTPSTESSTREVENEMKNNTSKSFMLSTESSRVDAENEMKNHTAKSFMPSAESSRVDAENAMKNTTAKSFMPSTESSRVDAENETKNNTTKSFMLSAEYSRVVAESEMKNNTTKFFMPSTESSIAEAENEMENFGNSTAKSFMPSTQSSRVEAENEMKNNTAKSSMPSTESSRVDAENEMKNNTTKSFMPSTESSRVEAENEMKNNTTKSFMSSTESSLAEVENEVKNLENNTAKSFMPSTESSRVDAENEMKNTTAKSFVPSTESSIAEVEDEVKNLLNSTAKSFRPLTESSTREVENEMKINATKSFMSSTESSIAEVENEVNNLQNNTAKSFIPSTESSTVEAENEIKNTTAKSFIPSTEASRVEAENEMKNTTAKSFIPSTESSRAEAENVTKNNTAKSFTPSPLEIESEMKNLSLATTQIPNSATEADFDDDDDDEYIDFSNRKVNSSSGHEEIDVLNPEFPQEATTVGAVTTTTVGTTTTTLLVQKDGDDVTVASARLPAPTTMEVTTEREEFTEIVTEGSGLEGDAETSDGTVIAITISTIGAVCLVLLAVLLFIMRRRQKKFNYGQRCTPVSLDSYSMDNVSVYNSVRRKTTIRDSKRSYGNPAFDDATVSQPLNFQALVKYANSLDEIATEFEAIPMVTARMSELPEGCDMKNRYANVIPLPETRVVLTPTDDDPTGDYINANYVTGPKGVRGYYIACQAPLSNTVNDFWRMIWEQQSRVILMLTHLFETGVEKCVDYLPPSEVLDCHRLFGDYQVTLKKREVKDKYIISSLQLKNMVTNSWREVTHLWYSGWPEKGVPSEENSIIAFLIEARSYVKLVQNSTDLKIKDSSNGGIMNSEVSPVVVHCSPGTGRTGTIIACDIAIREFELKRLVDIPRIVYRIRRDRASSVQTKDQYTFIYRVINLYATKLTGGALDSI